MSKDSDEEAKRIYGIAHAIAEKAHAGQFRNLPDGRPYIEHCKDVAAMMPTWELKTVAILHDAVEDTRGQGHGGSGAWENEERKTEKDRITDQDIASTPASLHSSKMTRNTDNSSRTPDTENSSPSSTANGYKLPPLEERRLKAAQDLVKEGKFKTVEEAMDELKEYGF